MLLRPLIQRSTTSASNYGHYLLENIVSTQKYNGSERSSDDSVKVLSPSWFIEGQDPYDHLAETNLTSLTRNELVGESLFRSKDIESYGTGIPRVKSLRTGGHRSGVPPCGRQHMVHFPSQ